HHPALMPRQRHLAHETIGSAVEELRILDEQALDLGLEGAGDADCSLERDGARLRRAQLQHHPAPVLTRLCDVGDHSACPLLSPAPADPLAKPRARSAKAFTLSSTSRLMVPAA